ncbi:response regulator [Cupriavidus sp. SW-Y-13]|uniref:response regulator n=1 Tax=Cupriavidus sp. SW-Y-13 TaxID=2653854 RepID=UPI0013655F19|nr:response regulator [Cupriavidus sp. SW-Y-13]MWL91546.1 response regulator [Cupriavidus sp. SW-Y-13]
MATVVVIDDETMNADALAFVLAAEGLEAHIAADGAAGLRVIYEVKPDVVITDFMMPVMTGFELARVLRANIETASLPLILLTAAQANLGREHPELFDAVFEKPCMPPEVIAAVHRLIDSKRK